MIISPLEIENPLAMCAFYFSGRGATARGFLMLYFSLPYLRCLTLFAGIVPTIQSIHKIVHNSL
jgi:hypothetical protein